MTINFIDGYRKHVTEMDGKEFIDRSIFPEHFSEVVLSTEIGYMEAITATLNELSYDYKKAVSLYSEFKGGSVLTSIGSMIKKLFTILVTLIKKVVAFLAKKSAKSTKDNSGGTTPHGDIIYSKVTNEYYNMYKNIWITAKVHLDNMEKVIDKVSKSGISLPAPDEGNARKYLNTMEVFRASLLLGIEYVKSIRVVENLFSSFITILNILVSTILKTCTGDETSIHPDEEHLIPKIKKTTESIRLGGYLKKNEDYSDEIYREVNKIISNLNSNGDLIDTYKLKDFNESILRAYGGISEFTSTIIDTDFMENAVYARPLSKSTGIGMLISENLEYIANAISELEKEGKYSGDFDDSNDDDEDDNHYAKVYSNLTRIIEMIKKDTPRKYNVNEIIRDLSSGKKSFDDALDNKVSTDANGIVAVYNSMVINMIS